MTARPRKDETADDWLSNFNDLSIEAEAEAQSSGKSDTASDKARKAKKRERDQKQKDISGETASSEATSFEGLKAKLGYAANARAKASLESAELDDISSRALEGIPRDTKSTDNASPDVRQAYESVLAGFMNESTSTATPNAKDDAPKQSGKEFVGRKARLANAQKWPGTKRLPIPTESAGEHKTPQVAKKKAGAGSTSAVDDILVAGGVTSSKKTTVQPEVL